LAVFKGKSTEADLIAAFDRNQAAKATAREMLIAAGRDLGEVDTYFMRVLHDRDGLLSALGREASLYDDALRAARKSKGRALTDEEELKVLNSLIIDSIRGQGGPGFLKPRTIETITQDLLRYYEPSDVADARWSALVAQDVGNRKFFGKLKPDADGIFTEDSSFGKTFGEGIASGAIRYRGQKMIKESMTSLFNNYKKHNAAVAKLAGAFRAAQTFGYLADAGTALVQFADIFSIMREYGVYSTKAYGKGMPKLVDAGVTEGHNVDVMELSRAGNKNPVAKAFLAPFKWSMKNLIGKADELQKSASMRAAWKAISGEARKPDSSFWKKVDSDYSKLFPDRWPEMKKSLQSDVFAQGEFDEHSSLFLFSELARLQPVTGSGRAEGFHNASPWGKSLFALRSYWLKQVGILRNQAYNEIKRGNVVGGFARLASYMAIVAVGQQAFQVIKDQALQRDVSPDEYAIGGVLQMIGIPRYAIYRRKQVGTGTAALETLVPGIGLLNDVGRDFGTIVKYATGHRKDGQKSIPTIGYLGQQLEASKYIPAVGREVYAWFGKGKLKERKERERKAMGGTPRPSTLDEILNIFSPEDTGAK
jgi:hypothetical protein